VRSKVRTNLNRKEAISLAHKHIDIKYPSALNEITKWNCHFDHGKWIIYPKLEAGVLGGGPTAEIDDNSGKVIKVYFSE
jgi:hypothetical protein